MILFGIESWGIFKKKKNFILVTKTKEFNLKQNEEKAFEAV